MKKNKVSRFQLFIIKKDFPGPRGFLSPRREKEEERKEKREETNSCIGGCESHYHATIGAN